MKSLLRMMIIISCVAQAQYRYGTTAANFLEIGTSSNAVGMGEAYVSLADDAISAYWNPAGLANVKGFEFGLSSQEWVVGIDHANFAAAVNMGRYGTISAWFTDFDYGSIEVTNVGDQDGTGEFYSANEIAASLAYGRNLVDWFSFGASIKMITSNIWHSSARATALDLGVIVKTNFFSKTDDRNNGMRIGMSISNYGSKMRYDGIDLINPIRIPLFLSSDVLHPNNNSESINMGTEYSLRMVGGNTFFLRGGVKGLGIAQANEKRSLSNIELPFSTLTFGLGYEKTLARNKSVGIDYSYQSIGLLGDVSLITVRFKLF